VVHTERPKIIANTEYRLKRRIFSFWSIFKNKYTHFSIVWLTRNYEKQKWHPILSRILECSNYPAIPYIYRFFPQYCMLKLLILYIVGSSNPTSPQFHFPTIAHKKPSIPQTPMPPSKQYWLVKIRTQLSTIEKQTWTEPNPEVRIFDWVPLDLNMIVELFELPLCRGWDGEAACVVDCANILN